MTLDWLHSRFGINFVAIGLVATVVAAAVVALQDVSFLVTGVWPRLPLYREVLYHLLATVAAIFSAVSYFVFRPGLPRFVAVVVAMSYGSYAVQPLADIHSNQLTVLCLARLLGLCSLLLLVRTYLVDIKAGRAAR
jgi:hypothetical protein